MEKEVSDLKIPRSTPLHASELIGIDEATEKALVVSVNSFLSQEAYLENLRSYGVAVMPCHVIKYSHIPTLKKYFNKDTGWSVAFFAGPCGQDCAASGKIARGKVSTHVSFRAIDPKDVMTDFKVAPPKLTTWQKVVKWFKEN